MPRMIYSERPKVTLMELLCASVVHPAMMHIMYSCLGEDRFREPAVGPKQKVGAKGNITAFMIPWEKIAAMLKNVDSNETILTRCGSDCVRVGHLWLSGILGGHQRSLSSCACLECPMNLVQRCNWK